MEKHLIVPFFPNPDDTHCFQAGLKMVLKYFEPDQDFSWTELDKATAKVEGLWTWPIAGALWLVNRGYELRVIEIFDYARFSEIGGPYLVEFYGAEAAAEQIKNSDIPQERRLAKKLLDVHFIEYRLPTIEDIKKLLLDGFLVCCNVNSLALSNKPGYIGHFVVIVGFTEHELILHDPGLLPKPNRHVSYQQFMKAWAYPDEKAQGLMAIRKLKK